MKDLALEQAPPLSAPLRFFLTGPLFGAAAGAVVAWEPEAVLTTRFSAQALAAVHLVTGGLMLQVMSGALLQLLPVAAGATVPRPRVLAWVTHLGLSSGAVALAAGFLGAGPGAMQFAAVVLAATIALYGAVAGWALARSKALGPTLPALRLAIFGLLVTAGLGAAMAGSFGWGWALPLFQLTLLHAAWGVLGWSLMLVAAVAYLVVPMFQLTPPYPLKLATAVPWLLFGGLLAWTAAITSGAVALRAAATALLAGATIAFAAATLNLQRKRKRKILDTTFWCWRLGSGCLLAAAAVGSALQLPLPGAWWPKLEYLLGVLLFAGAFPALIAGMLVKVVSFLGWLHLSRVTPTPPSMHELVSERRARPLVWSFSAALVLLAAGAAAPWATRLGGALFALTCLWLEALMAWAAVVYWSHASRARAAQGNGPG